MSFRGQIWWSGALFAQMHGEKGRVGHLGKSALLFPSCVVFVYALRGRVLAEGLWMCDELMYHRETMKDVRFLSPSGEKEKMEVRAALVGSALRSFNFTGKHVLGGRGGEWEEVLCSVSFINKAKYP